MGCNRYLTRAEHEQSRAQRSAMVKDIGPERREEIRSAMHRVPAKLIRDILNDSHHRAHQSVKMLLAKSIGCSMKVLEEQKVAKALAVVLKDHPSAMGLFEKAPSHYGPGATPVSHHYEITATAALIQAPRTSISGKRLQIASSDRMDFGIKMAAGYAQPKRFGTIEADVMIRRKVLQDEKIIAIDTKFSESGRRGVPDKRDFARQLDGIRTGFRDEKIHEFFFVTNGQFKQDFKEMVQAENLRIARDYVKTNRHLYRDVDQSLITDPERPSFEAGKIPRDFFVPENADTIQRLAERLHMPQIELCEEVRFK